MKIKLLGTIFSVAFLVSCSVLTSPKYTKVEKIIKLEEGMNIAEVTATLGIEPYDVLHIQKDGTTLLLFHYKHKERVVTTNIDNEISLTQNRKVKYIKPSRLFVLLDDDQKLQSVFSEEGLKNSPYIVRIDQILHRINSVSNKFEPLSDTALFWYQPPSVEPEKETKKKKK